MAAFTIADVSTSADGRSVTCTVEASGETGAYLANDEFVVRYSDPVDSVPDGVLVVPALANLCPLAWTLEADVRVPELDEQFADALPDVRRGFGQLYPDTEFGGDVLADEYAHVDRGRTDDSMLLFSGGVDSIASYVRHAEADPILATAYYTDAELTRDEETENVRSWVRSFADREDARSLGIQSNLRAFLDPSPAGPVEKDLLLRPWWPKMQHGLGLLGLCAPAAVANGVGDLYIAATHTEAFDPGWGSHPKIDDRVRWSGTEAHHDGWDLTRQQKVELIEEYADAEYERVPVRACWQSDDGLNCGRCEKCCRTILGLELAGLDAANHGFDVPEDVFQVIRSGLRADGWRIGADEEFMWEDLQNHADPAADYRREGMDEFVDWFVDVDLARVRSRSESMRGIKSRVGTFLPGPTRSVAKSVGEPLLRRFL